ncbi:MAG: FctA domain-containing protein, partial [Eggerthellaceae bacterium]|nr:FctA domain-containing protein [Eggerthellaceae bacterium]
ETTEVFVKKIWEGPEASATITLVADGTATDQTITLPDSNKKNEGSFAGLPKYNNDGTAIVYTVTEAAIDNYSTTGPTGEGTEASPFTFTNTYKATGSVALTASKELVGREWIEGEEFTFTLLDTQGEVYDTKTVSSNTSVTFKAFEYTEADIDETYIYTISETGTLPDGVEKSADITATVKVSDAGGGKLSFDVSYDNDDKIINTYTAKPVKAEINVTKTIQGFIEGADPNGNVVDRTFTVTMKGPKIEDELSVDITTSGGTGSANFGEIEYTFEDMVDDSGNQVTEKDFTYTVTETAGSDPGFDYDDNDYTVVVTVKDNQKGQLEVTNITKVEGGTTNVEIVNKFTEESTDVILTVNKKIDDQSNSAKDATFTFQLTDPEGTTVYQEKKITTSGLTGSVDFEKLTFDAAGEYNYLIIESEGGDEEAGWENDKSVHEVTIVISDDFEVAVLQKDTTIDGKETTTVTFTNIYKAASTTSILKVTKKVEDMSGSAPDVTFEFTLEGVGTSPMPKEGTVVTAKDGDTAEFGEITFEQAGDFAYTITETVGGEGAAWTNDMAAHDVIVSVQDVAGQLVATVQYDGSETATVLEVTNIYEPEPAVIAPQARKVVKELAGVAPKNVEFTFELIDPDGKTVETVTRTDGGYVYFSDLTFDTIGTYKYQIKETKGGQGSLWTNDTTAHDAIITVTDPYEGQLAAEISYDGKDELVITNTFEVEPVMIDPPVQKTVKGSPATDETFTFQLKAVSEDAPMPDDKVGGTKTITITGSGSEEFGPIYYYVAGNYTYEITEIAGSAKGYTYDDTKYFLAVAVTANKDGSLNVAQKVVDGNSNIVDKASFTNTYEEEPPTIPQTGDDLTGIIPPIAIAAVASGLLMLGASRKLRRED